MRKLKTEPRFERDAKNCDKKHWDMPALKEAIDGLVASDEKEIPPSYKDHALAGALAGKRALHINNASQPKSDVWVLLYQIINDEIVLLRTGTHDEVYGK